MPGVPLSEHCSLMGRPGGPPPPKQLPPDCPKGAAYIKTTDKGSNFTIRGDAPFPLVFEGGDGNDTLTLVGHHDQQILVSGGKGNDSVRIEDPWAMLVTQLDSQGVVVLGALALALAAVVIIGWRALGPSADRRL